MNKKLGVVLALGFLIAAGGGCGKPAPAASPAVPVKIGTVERLSVGKAARYSASIVPNEQIELMFKSGGYVGAITQVRGADGRIRALDVGDFVKAGTVLASVRPTDYRDRITQAEADLAKAKAAQEQAKLSFDRASILFTGESATKPEYDQAKAQFDTANAAVKEARAQLSLAHTQLEDSILRAPRDGWIARRNIVVGSLVSPAAPAFSLLDTHYVRVSFGVPDTAIQQVRLGQKLRVTTETVGDFEGRVTSISPAADPNSRVFSVEITLPNPGDRLKAGMIASLAMGEPAPAEVTVLPLGAVLRSPRDPNAFLVMVPERTADGYIARARTVQLGDAYGNDVAITSGLQPGAQIITTGASLVHEGDRLQLIP